MAIIAELTEQSIDAVASEVVKQVKNALLPTGKLTIEANGTYNVKDYGYVKVVVPQDVSPASGDINLFYQVIADKDGKHAVVTATVGETTKNLYLSNYALQQFVSEVVLDRTLNASKNGTYDVRDYKSIVVNVPTGTGKQSLDEFTPAEIKTYTLTKGLITNKDFCTTFDEDKREITVALVGSNPLITVKTDISDRKVIKMAKELPNKDHSLEYEVNDNGDFKFTDKVGIQTETEFISFDENVVTITKRQLTNLYENQGHTLVIDPSKEDIKLQPLYTKEDGRVYAKVDFVGNDVEYKLNELDYRTVAHAIDYKFDQEVSGDEQGNIKIKEKVKMLCPHERNIYPLTEDNITVDVDTTKQILTNAGYTVTTDPIRTVEDVEIKGIQEQGTTFKLPIKVIYDIGDDVVYDKSVESVINGANIQNLLSNVTWINKLTTIFDSCGYKLSKKPSNTARFTVNWTSEHIKYVLYTLDSSAHIRLNKGDVLTFPVGTVVKCWPVCDVGYTSIHTRTNPYSVTLSVGDRTYAYTASATVQYCSIQLNVNIPSGETESNFGWWINPDSSVSYKVSRFAVPYGSTITLDGRNLTVGTTRLLLKTPADTSSYTYEATVSPSTGTVTSDMVIVTDIKKN